MEDGHDDSYLFIHTNAHGTYPRAYDLPIWRAMLGMEEHILFPSYNPIISPVSNAQLARVHNAGDVYWQNSVAEKWEDLIVFPAFKRYALGAITGLVYFVGYSERSFPNGIMCFVSGYAATAFIQSLVNRLSRVQV
ncbi:unnamed protein product [marine sediment metagenome]|uniref:Uncharacterized protein n=1 Tax=marine sediment metagenome TaxID=412755 RepID=X1NHZ4_9ZZZZ